MAVPSTYRVGYAPVATITAPVHMPTGTPAAPFWYERIRSIPYGNLILSHGYFPGFAFFEAAIGVLERKMPQHGRGILL